MGRVSRQDLKTILLCGIHLAKLDDNFHFMEKKFLRRFSEAINLTEGEREDLLAMGGSLAENVGLLTSDDARELLLKTLCAVSYVDGNASDEEYVFIEKVRDSLALGFEIKPREEWSAYEEAVFTAIEQPD
jgi:tellurite resistance protein